MSLTQKQEDTEKHAGGRPSKYDPEFCAQVTKLCELGATDAEIADFFEVHVATINRWKLDYPEFCESIKSGKVAADERVERSLYQKATGFDYTEEQAFKVKKDSQSEEVEVVEVRKRALPETVAAIFWLKNRRRDDWRDKQEIDHNVREFMVSDTPEETEEGWENRVNGNANGKLNGSAH